MTGVFVLLLYLSISYWIGSIGELNFIGNTLIGVYETFNLNEAQEVKVVHIVILIWHIFWISAISGFFGIPLARILEGCIYNRSKKKYTQLRREIISTNLPDCKWQKVLLILQEKQYHTVLTKFRKYIVDGEKLDIPEYRGVLGSIRHMSRLATLLLTVENVMQKESHFTCEKMVSYYRSRIRLLFFRSDYYRYMMTFMYFIVPLIVAIIISILLTGTVIVPEKNGLHSFFIGAGLIIASLQLSLMAYSQISLLAYLWRKQCKRFDDMIFKLYALSISLAIFIIIFIIGSYQLGYINNSVGSSLKDLLVTSSNLILPFINTQSENNLIKGIPSEIRIILQASTAIIFSIGLKLIFEYILGKYEQSTSGEQEKHFSLPAELISIFGMFFIFIIATGLIYSSLISNPKSPKGEEVSASSISSSAHSHSSGASDSTKTANKPSDNDKIGDFLPYSIFLALVGAVLAISTRELLENYFSGIAMKVDMPFEQGDRLNIPDIGMCEVREVGLRSVKLYSIPNNSIIYFPNKEISKTAISNYTQPTLDYRRTLYLNISSEFNKNKHKHNMVSRIESDFKEIEDCSQSHLGVIETARSLLLISAYMSTGVKKPSARRFFSYNWRIENLSDEIENPNRGMKYSADRDIEEYLKKEKNDIEGYSLISLLEKVATQTHYDDVDDDDLKEIWNRLKLIQKISDQPLEDLIIFDVPSLLDDASIIKRSVRYMDTNYIKRAKIRVAKILHILYKLEDSKYGIVDQDFAGSKYLSASMAWSLSGYVSCLINQYFSLNELLWGLKSQSEGQTGKRTIDSARLKFQDLPRVKADQKITSEGDVYWNMTLSITVGLAEQSDEILYNINKRIDWYWDQTGLSKNIANK